MRGTSWARRGPIFVQLPFMGFPIGLGLLLLFGLAAPWFFHLLPFLIFFLIPAYGLATARIGQAPIHGTRAAHLPAPRDEDHKEKELLKVLERRAEINAARAAPETSLSVSEADKMLSRLPKDGHLQVRVREGTLTYAMWE
jgi:hypothetical protein